MQNRFRTVAMALTLSLSTTAVPSMFAATPAGVQERDNDHRGNDRRENDQRGNDQRGNDRRGNDQGENEQHGNGRRDDYYRGNEDRGNDHRYGNRDYTNNRYYNLGNREGYQDYNRKAQRKEHKHKFRNKDDREAHDNGYHEGWEGRRGYHRDPK